MDLIFLVEYPDADRRNAGVGHGIQDSGVRALSRAIMFSIREREASMARERSQLLEKNEMARSRIENMIARLKALTPES
jgi:hypothetical protein